MRIARYLHGSEIGYGSVEGEGVRVLDGSPFERFEVTAREIPLADVRLLSPVHRPSKVVCVGLNYAAHRNDLAHVDAPDNPLIFLKPSTAVIGPGDEIEMPPVDGRIVHEGELVVVIGRTAKRVAAADWRDHVLGFTIGNDVSARDQMFADGQWARAKGYDTFAPLGPWIETELDPSDLEIRTFVDGEPRRHGRTSEMLHKVPELIEYISDVWTLLPGDVIMTGTPAGTGGFLHGQEVTIEISGIGTLSNPARTRV